MPFNANKSAGGSAPPIRQLSLLDKVLIEVDHGLRTLSHANHGSRPNPAKSINSAEQLSATEKAEAASLMRVNHAGEIAAQALYRGQALVAKTEQQRAHLHAAGDEEQDHLDWCAERIEELGGKPSVLDPLWYAGSFAIGVGAGLAGDKLSLGFVEETEIQVAAHLDSHLDKLPENDQRSQAILQKMRAEEAEHAADARTAGAQTLPKPIKNIMRVVAKVMTSSSYKI